MSQTPGRNVNPPRFVAGEPVSARKLNMLSDALGGGVGAGDYDLTYNPPFMAKVTGFSGAAFAWTEQGQTNATTWANLQGGRSGTTSVNPAYEANGRQGMPVQLVWMHEEIDVNGGRRYWFIAPNSYFPVTVERTGGSDGSSSTPASWLYTVRSLIAGVTLGSNVAVSRPRPNGKMVYQAGSSGYGQAFYDGATLKLWDAGEVENTSTECPA